MKKLLAIVPLLAGCVNPSTGRLSVVPSFLRKGAVEEPSVKAMAFAQLAPLVWISIPLIICGIFWWKMTGGSTGLGKTAVATGFLFIAIAVVFPAIVGYLGVITVITFIGAIGYAIYYYIISKKKKGEKHGNSI